jgi:hypothetical protein
VSGPNLGPRFGGLYALLPGPGATDANMLVRCSVRKASRALVPVYISSKPMVVGVGLPNSVEMFGAISGIPRQSAHKLFKATVQIFIAPSATAYPISATVQAEEAESKGLHLCDTRGPRIPRDTGTCRSVGLISATTVHAQIFATQPD